MKRTILILSILIGAIGANAQSKYTTAIGGRIGSPIAFSIKQFVSSAGAIEGFAGISPSGNYDYSGPGVYDRRFSAFTFGAMYQHHFPIGNVPGFKWYIGGGVLGEAYNYKGDRNGNPSARAGINGVGGVDYKFAKIPLNLSADIMPTYLFGNADFYSFRANGGVAVRYAF